MSTRFAPELVLPRLTPPTDLGGAATAAYAARMGVTEDESFDKWRSL